MTPLGREIRELIAADGPIAVERYMALALGHPRHGYYMTRDPLGAAGDFTTAPEISQMFGELLGIWAAEVWRLIGSPRQVRLVELGPGRGTLMADALRAARVQPGFLAAADVHLVETSPALSAVQARTLAASAAPVSWHTHLADVPGGPTILIANEFFDALPICQYVRAAGRWRERCVGLGDDGDLVFGLAAQPTHSSPLIPPPCGEGRVAPQARSGVGVVQEAPLAPCLAPPAPSSASLSPPSPQRGGKAAARNGDILEVGAVAASLIGEIAERIASDGGAALIVDYGHARGEFGDTLQAVRRHAYADPLAEPGEADLTAHVDFAALTQAADRHGARAHGPVGQGDFLRALGIEARAAQLRRGGDAAAVDAALERLAGSGDGRMGALFKAIGFAPAALASLPGLPAPHHASARRPALEAAC